jgi:hypothetical protein
MITKKHFFSIILIFSIALSTTFFVKRSNDHKECDTVVKKELNKNGHKVVTREHICKEKYSF